MEDGRLSEDIRISVSLTDLESPIPPDDEVPADSQEEASDESEESAPADADAEPEIPPVDDPPSDSDIESDVEDVPDSHDDDGGDPAVESGDPGGPADHETEPTPRPSDRGSLLAMLPLMRERADALAAERAARPSLENASNLLFAETYGDSTEPLALHPPALEPPSRLPRVLWLSGLFVAAAMAAFVGNYLGARWRARLTQHASHAVTVAASAGVGPSSAPPAPPAKVQVEAKQPSKAVPVAFSEPDEPATGTQPNTGDLHTTTRADGHRVFVDGKVVGNGAGTYRVSCGKHTVRVGTIGVVKEVNVPCGGDVTVR